MSIPVTCGCGASWSIADEELGPSSTCPQCGFVVEIPPPPASEPSPAAPAAPAALKRCPYCSARVPKEAAFCSACGRSFGGASAPRRPRPAASALRRPTARAFPWEVLVVIGLIALDVVLGMMSLSNLKPEVAFGALAADAIMILGLALRRTWGLWVTLILLGLRTLFMFSLVARAHYGADTSLATILMCGNGISVVLLIICMARGAYSKE